MRIEYLKDAIRLAETLNFTQAANDLFVSQPVLSKHIVTLEKEIGLKLFVRTKHEVRVTRAGKAFLEDARKVVNDYDSMMSNLNLDKRSLHVGFVFGSMSSCIIEIQKRFRDVRPDVDVQYHSYSSIREPREQLECGAVDVVLGATQESWVKGAYRYRVLGLDSYAFILSESDVHAESSTLSGKALKGYTLLVPDEQLLEQDAEAFEYMKASGIEDLQPVLHDMNSIPIMIEANKSASFGQKALRNFYGERSKLSFVSIEGLDLTLPIVAIWKYEDETDALLALVDIAEDVYRCE